MRTAVQLALAEKLNHSSGPVEQDDALRRQKNARVRKEGEEQCTYDALQGLSAPLPGTRPAPLLEVAGLQGRLVVPACPCGGVPSLVSVVMVQEAAHDDASVSYLFSRTLLAKEVEELKAQVGLQGSAADESR